MTSPAVLPYVAAVPGTFGLMPPVPPTLDLNGVVLTDIALLDTGAAVNVLPYPIGLRLGGDWSRIAGNIPLVGNLGNYPAKPLFVRATVGPFPPVRLAFAWSQSPITRILLGQTNFFQEFDVCFYRRRGELHLQPATP